MMFCKLLSALPFVASALSKPLEPRALSDFSMYAYGSDGINGFPVISINNTVYITSHSVDDIGSQAHNVTFDAPETRGNFTASVDGQGQSLFYVPSSSGPVGFTNTTNDDSFITSGFGFYGHVIFVQIGSVIQTEWIAVPTNDSAVWLLSWNVEDQGVPVALRNIAPTA
ncbi:hypothetical protein BKA67DRAFT_656641 [Truncatella angustata]|uniref:Uncharacterized protein n=1 Tax=Truncatella angustata TaxID=152316 RepID=A0A9P8UUA3_9PEZI|nr:uncharacterized protein BKA67DRAFT_656641 [Truncatella angustata]KAH6658451.1 hypothetical protein BKA67DRAFT_656641 [Truncatella angustata]